MTQLSFVTLDVFTLKAYGGNPLAVVFLPENFSKGFAPTLLNRYNSNSSLPLLLYVGGYYTIWMPYQLTLC